jgi:hypothetical protein
MTPQEHREEIKKCSQSPYYFATKYLKCKTHDGEIPFITALSEKEFNKYIFKFNNK